MTPVVTLTDAPTPDAETTIGEGLAADIFFLPESLRGHGLGGRILGMAEEEARARGCITSMLYTISFQAPEFYEKHGYRVSGGSSAFRRARAGSS